MSVLSGKASEQIQQQTDIELRCFSFPSLIQQGMKLISVLAYSRVLMPRASILRAAVITGTAIVCILRCDWSEGLRVCDIGAAMHTASNLSIKAEPLSQPLEITVFVELHSSSSMHVLSAAIEV